MLANTVCYVVECRSVGLYRIGGRDVDFEDLKKNVTPQLFCCS